MVLWISRENFRNTGTLVIGDARRKTEIPGAWPGIGSSALSSVLVNFCGDGVAQLKATNERRALIVNAPIGAESLSAELVG